MDFPGLVIAKYEGPGECYLFLCDPQWETLNDTDHQNVDEARELAERLYPGIDRRWQEAG